MKGKILILDDEPDVRKLLLKILENDGFVCTEASSAKQARACLKEQQFDLLLCDILMPDESGLNIAELTITSYPDTAVVILTGVDDPDTANKAFDMGVYGYLIKPFEHKQFLITVQNAFRRQELEKKEKSLTTSDNACIHIC